jgi:hypothetical protein
MSNGYSYQLKSKSKWFDFNSLNTIHGQRKANIGDMLVKASKFLKSLRTLGCIWLKPSSLHCHVWAESDWAAGFSLVLL